MMITNGNGSIPIPNCKGVHAIEDGMHRVRKAVSNHFVRVWYIEWPPHALAAQPFSHRYWRSRVCVRERSRCVLEAQHHLIGRKKEKRKHRTWRERERDRRKMTRNVVGW